MMQILLGGAIIVSSLLACNAVHVEGIDEGGDLLEKPIEEVLTKPEEITFETVKAYVLEPACLRCHGDGRVEGRIDLSSYELLTTPPSSLRPSVVPFSLERSPLFNTLNAKGKLQMPPAGERPQLDEMQKKIVSIWISNGAINDVGEPPPEEPLSLKDELEPYFLKPETIDYFLVQQYVFNESCNECHSDNGSKPDDDAIMYGADLTNYKTIMDNPFLEIIKPGKPKVSDLFQTVANQEMPAAKDGYDPVNAFKVKLLRLWILNCAVETVPDPSKDHFLEKSKDPEQIRDCNPPEPEPEP